MRLIVCIFLFLCFLNSSFAFGFKKRKPKVKPPKMVETTQDCEQEAKDVPLEDRTIEPIEPPITDKKNYFPEMHYTFELYNYPPGTRGYDIRFIKKNLVEHPIMISDKQCHYVAYANYYYRADIDQIYSDFYVEKLDTSKTKTQRILDYNHRQLKRTPVLLSGFKEQYKNLFNGLSLVDWSADSNKVLIKESIGSTLDGIYTNHLYVYYLDKEKTVKLTNFEKALLNYYLDYEEIQLSKFRYILEPLGFSADNDNLVVANLYAYNVGGKKIFLGVWGYDLIENKTIMISKTNPTVSISANGLALKQVLE